MDAVRDISNTDTYEDILRKLGQGQSGAGQRSEPAGGQHQGSQNNKNNMRICIRCCNCQSVCISIGCGCCGGARRSIQSGGSAPRSGNQQRGYGGRGNPAGSASQASASGQGRPVSEDVFSKMMQVIDSIGGKYPVGSDEQFQQASGGSNLSQKCPPPQMSAEGSSAEAPTASRLETLC